MESWKKPRPSAAEQGAMGTFMKTAMVFVLLFGWLIGQRVHAEAPTVQRSPWVIFVTVVDRTTGQQIKQGRLEGSDLEFEDRTSCQSILDKVAPIPSDFFKVVLTCHKVGGGQA